MWDCKDRHVHTHTHTYPKWHSMVAFQASKTHLLLFEHTLASCLGLHLRQSSGTSALNQPGQSNTGKHALRTSSNDSVTKYVPCEWASLMCGATIAFFFFLWFTHFLIYNSAELISNPDCPPASCCHSFTRLFGDDNNNQLFSGKQDVQETKKQVVWFYYYLSMGRWWGSSVLMWCVAQTHRL